MLENLESVRTLSGRDIPRGVTVPELKSITAVQSEICTKIPLQIGHLVKQSLETVKVPPSILYQCEQWCERVKHFLAKLVFAKQLQQLGGVGHAL